MEPKSPTVIYAGPSLTAESRELIKKYNLDLRPAIKRHDLPALMDHGFEGSIIIVDGVFHQNLALGHAEIRTALEKGNEVFGLSSIGAIRAYEMRHLGMKGYGQVFDYFLREVDFQDDEVALKYFPMPPYTEQSEPLVHFRVCVDHLVNKKLLSKDEGSKVISNLKSRYYGERTMNLFLSLVNEYSPNAVEVIKDDFDQFRIKKKDLVRFLKEKVWMKKSS